MAQSDPTSTAPDLIPLLLIAANVVGIGIGYSITIILARHLSLFGFEQYVGTVATLGLLASLGEAGFGKYALKTVPVLVTNGSFQLLKGYLRFAIVGSLALSLVLGLLALVSEVPLRNGAAERVVLVAIVFLPLMAGAGVAIDLLMAFRQAGIATLIARIIMPLTTLAAMGALILSSSITPFSAIVCFGLGSTAAFLLAVYSCWVKARPMVRGVQSEQQVIDWTLQSFSFLAFAFLTSWIFKATLVLIHHLPHEGNELAMLAPAFETGCLILLFSKSTDKYFQPTMSVIIESHDWPYLQSVRKQRYLIIGSGIVTFLAVISLFGKPILRLFGEDFVVAYPALVLISIGSSLWTLFSMAPSFLLFAGQKRALLINFLSHGLILTVLTTLLFLHYGVVGAAAAYALSIGSLSLVNLWLAERCFIRSRNR
jgi:O-antigen/teichoic acid export membrane protein